MAKKAFYVFGKTGENESNYDDETLYDRLKIFICDTASDLPATGMNPKDMAIVINDAALYTVKDSAWIGNDRSASWPVGSVILLVPATNPAELLEFGVWQLVNQDILPVHVWRRTE